MFVRIRLLCTSFFVIAFLVLLPQSTSGQERLCDPSFEDCYNPLLELVRNENAGIDIAFYMIELPGLANAIISRHQAGVPVRIIVEPRAALKFPGNQPLLDQFSAAGIPMRYKLGDGIVHIKVLLLAGQNKVVFTGSNFGDADVWPYEPYANYVDGAWYISDDPAVVNSFKTRLDDVWTDTNTYGNYANIAGALARKYPTLPVDPSMNFLPNQDSSQDYGARTISQIDRETQQIDLTMYRVTDVSICDALLRARARGVPVRLLAEPREYRFDSSRLGAELTGPYNIDRMHAAGIQIKMRKHRGLNHQKSVSLYSRGLTIFGSSNWSWESFNYQEEHNYFTTKTWFFQWFVNQFNRKWSSATEYEPFVPLPPTAPVNISPADSSTAGAGSVTLTWEGGQWAHKYDIYFGQDPSNLSLIASDVITGTLGSSGSENYVASGLQTGRTYYWRIDGKTMANQSAAGPVWRFTTSGTPPPPPPAPTVTAISPNSGTTSGGTSVSITGANFASGAALNFGGTTATNINVVNSTTITATTPARPAGAVNVVVTNPDGQVGTLVAGYTYAAPAPQPPTVTSVSPSTGTTAGGTSVTITGTNFASGATLQFGGAAATNVNVLNSTTITARTPAHAAGAVNVVVTNTSGLSGTLTAGYTYTSPPPSSSAEVVLSAAEAPVKIGGWTVVSDGSAAGGLRIHYPDAGAPKVTTPSANPGNHFEMTFTADAGRAYRLWIRGKAQNDFWGNDSIWVQFSDSVNSSGSPAYRIGTTSGTEINLEDCSGCGLSGWGWQDIGRGVGVLGTPIYFESSGTHTLRVQVREDGLSVDQIVLSSETYLNSSPGALKNDATILPKSDSPPPPPPPAPAPTITAVSPGSGATGGGTAVTVTGANFVSGATLTFGGVAATNVSVTGPTTLTASTPAHAAGVVSVVITNPDGQSGTLSNAFTYAASSETTILEDNFNDNALDSAKWTVNNLFSGYTDSSVPTTETSQRLQIGSLPQGQSGSHYNGIRSSSSFDFSGAYCQVELVQAAASATRADAMLTVGNDVSNYYRMYVEQGAFICQTKIGGVKRNVFTEAYDAAAHRFWRIRHDQPTGRVVFETAPGNAGLPGPWVLRYGEQWSSTVLLTGILFEIKAGTWQSEGTAPGLVIFDNFKAARP